MVKINPFDMFIWDSRDFNNILKDKKSSSSAKCIDTIDITTLKNYALYFRFAGPIFDYIRNRKIIKVDHRNVSRVNKNIINEI